MVDTARRYGFVASEIPPRRFSAKLGSHDDGPEHGMFLGPVGGPAFSRDLYGRFSRWHLQPGMHVIQPLDPAFLAVRWTDPGSGKPRCVRLRREDAASHEVAALHPLSHEIMTFETAPFRVVLTCFSPVLPGDEDAASLPVVVFSVDVEPLAPGGELPELDVAAFWPNLNGWRASQVTSDNRGDIAWPGHHHAGNVNRPADLPAGTPGGAAAAVVQSRRPAVAVPEDVCGDVALAVAGDGESFSRQVQFSLYPLPTGEPPTEQDFTFDAVYEAFRRTGRLGVTPDSSWPAHWHEPVGSAVAAHVAGGRSHARVRFVLAFDWPVVRFTAGRCWYRRYARNDAGAAELAARALRDADSWLAAADSWQQATLAELAAGWSDRVAGCLVNEVNLAVSLGTAWVDGNPDGHRPDGPSVTEEHLALLEGFDNGYFYYNTSDLWHYAFPALTLTWPRLADLVFDDLAAALDAEIPAERPIYRPAEHRRLLVARKLPHDLGSAAEDPFVRPNGYALRDDPNTWRDSNPAFVLATAAHHTLLGRPLADDTWRRLADAAELVAEQAPDAAVPRHDEFGDSTWDNLGLRGHSTYTAALCAGMWAVLAREAAARGQDPERYEERLDAARRVLDGLWTGSHFRAASEGKYVRAVMGDSLMGVYYADVCGTGPVVSRDRVRAHLRAAYEVAHLGYHDGTLGPLLVAERRNQRYEPDGGQELQVNEVIVGSGWLLAAMLTHYRLADEARAVAASLASALYGGSGLQFRTPAAIDADGRFRAPLNMRPLAAWWLLREARNQ